MRRALRLLPKVLAGLALGAFLLTMLVPRLLGWDLRTVLSGSMEPNITAGAVVAVKPVDPAGINRNDVITFSDEGRLVTHRVTEVVRNDSGLRFVTKGDANEDPDTDAVPAAAVQGRVVFSVPLLGRLLVALRTPIGFGLLVVLPGLAFMSSELIFGRRRNRQSASRPEGT